MKFSLSQLPESIYWTFYNADRIIFGDDEDAANLRASVESDGAIKITHDEHIWEYVIEKGEDEYDWFHKKMVGYEIKEISDFEVIDCMYNRGGSFVFHLSKLARYADSENLQKIKDAWPEYWEKYKKMAENS